ncbi:hypothetical protein SOVF_102760 [Spinacia oleracea]|nr:hypothetical protein SOVF_102760 [Spinacia oleracea]
MLPFYIGSVRCCAHPQERDVRAHRPCSAPPQEKPLRPHTISRLTASNLLFLCPHKTGLCARTDMYLMFSCCSARGLAMLLFCSVVAIAVKARSCKFKAVTKEICKLPSFFSIVLFQKIDVNGTEFVTSVALMRLAEMDYCGTTR